MDLFDTVKNVGKGFVNKSANLLTLGEYGKIQRDQQLNDLIKQFDPGKRPEAPQFYSQIDPNTGLLKDVYTVSPELSQGYQDVLSRVRSSALLPEDQLSGAGKALQEQLKLAEKGQLEKAITSQAQSLAGARGQLARQGGLSSAATANLARGGQRDLNRALQNIRSQTAQASLGITAKDLQDRQNLLLQLGGLENQAQQFSREGQQFNIGNALQEIQAKRDADQARYAEDIRNYAAGKQAQATLAAGLGAGGKK